MFKNFIFLGSLLLFVFNISAQRVTGTLKDSGDHSRIATATVSILKTDSSTVVSETVSNAEGLFTFRNVKKGDYVLEVSSIGYTRFLKAFTVNSSTLNLGELSITQSAEVLSTIVIDGTPPPVLVKGDTTEILASQFKVNPDANTEDLIKKMPGITVDKRGNVTAQGESVRKVTVDGRDFFGDDATAALKNLPSEIVDRIQVFDRLSDQAQLTGFDDGNSFKSINIVTKTDMRQGNFGRVYAGYGTDDRYQGGGNISFFKDARRISIVGLMNNVNQQNFSSDDMTNMGGGSRRGGYRRDDGFSVGPQSGIARTNAIGLNYSDQWGKKLEVSGSYFFNNNKVNNDQTANTQFLNPDAKSFYDENTLSGSKNFNNRANLRIKYNIDSNNTIMFTANGSFQNSDAGSSIIGLMTGDDHLQNISRTISNFSNTANGYQINTDLTYSHTFPKKGRSVSLGVRNNFNNNKDESFNYAVNDYYKTVLLSDTIDRFTDQANKSNRYGFSLRYTEPINSNWQIQFNYDPSFQHSNADQRTYDYDDAKSGYTNFQDSLSNTFTNDYNTHNTGITIRRGGRDRNNMLSAGVSYQYSELMSDRIYPTKTDVYHSYNNILGNVMARFKIGEFGNMMLRYRGGVNSPSVTQLQDVINTNNPLFYSTGNPDLQQQYSHRLFSRYTLANRVSGISFFANIFATKVDNFITNASFTARNDSTLSQGIILHKGSQISKPINLDGNYSINSFFNFSVPLKFIKSNLNLNAGVGYSRLPGMVDYITNISNNFNYNGGLVLASNINEYIDFDLSYSVNFNDVENTINPGLNNNYYTQSAGVNLTLLSKKGTFLQNNLSNESYSGLSQGFNQSYWLWNVSVGQKFLKGQMGELRLSVFDLLKHNKSIVRNVTATQIQDLKNQVLQQYFMLTFTYKLRNFGKPPAENNRRGGPHFGGGSMM